MSVSRFLSSLKNQSANPLNLFRRYVPSKRFHSSSNMRSSRSSKQPRSPLLFPEQTPTSESRSSYIILTALLGGVGAAAIFIRYNDERRAVLKGEAAKHRETTTKGPKFTLIDTKGQLFTEHDLLRNWVLMYFGYTSSPDVGPAEVEKMAKAVDVLESKQNLKVLPIFVTIDPQRDTPSQLRAYLQEFDSRIVGLTGPPAAIRQMAHEFRVFFKKVEEEGDDYLVDSSHNMYLMNPNMEIVRCFGVEYSADELSEAIHGEIKKRGT